MNIVVNVVSDNVMKMVGKEAAKAAAKIGIGVGCEVAIHFISKKVIETIENAKKEKEVVIAEEA